METVFQHQKELCKLIVSHTSNLGKLPTARRTTENLGKIQADFEADWEKFVNNHTTISQYDQNIIKDQPYVKDKTYEKTNKNADDFYKKLNEFLKVIREKETKQKQITKTMDIKKTMLSEALSENITEMALEELEATLEVTKYEWNDYRAAYSSYREQTTAQYDGQEYREIHGKYVSFIGSVQNKIKKLKPQENMNTHEQREKLADLPKIKIPEFDGKVSNWTTFYELFDQIVHKNTNVSNATKMQYLKSFIKGDAARLIHHIQPTAENYETAYIILKKRYENTRILLGKLLDSIIDLPALQHESCAELRAMHDTVYECLMGIKNLRVNTENWDALLTHILIKKLDRETRKYYECQIADPREPQTVENFLKYIEGRFMALEAYEPTSTPPNRSKNTHETTKSKNQNCAHCPGEHAIFKCNEFKKMSEQERFNEAKNKKLCMKCLLDNHKTNDCKSQFKCTTCQKGHNTLIHINEYGAKNANTRQSRAARETPQQNVNTLLTIDNPNVLLATALVKITAKNGSHIVLKAVIDQGSQGTFITENAAQMLNLPRKRVTAVITGIGAREKTAKYCMALTQGSLTNTK